MSFFNKNAIFSRNQYGFLRGKSTVDAVAALVERVTNAMEDDTYSLATFLDLSSAFDCVHHDILLQKLNKYGVRGTPLTLIRSYLENRSQYVTLPSSSSADGFCQSTSSQINCGVPQGSILGPFLFIVYLNSLVTNNIVYADDTTCLTSETNLKNLEIKANIQVNELAQKLAALKLKVNPNKTGIMVFKPVRRPLEFEPVLHLLDHQVKEKDCIKFLGMHLVSHGLGMSTFYAKKFAQEFLSSDR